MGSSAHQPRFRLAVPERDVTQQALTLHPINVFRVLQIDTALAKLTATAKRKS
jgi:hypothetical protein